MTAAFDRPPGAPGTPARWASAAKTGMGTALNPVSDVWFTLSHGILTEVFRPFVDMACTRERMAVADIISPDALCLVRFGLRSADDPRIVNPKNEDDMSTRTADRRHKGHTGSADGRERPTEKRAPGKTKVSNEEWSQLIQVRAYCLWEQAGKPDGDAARERFWHEAEKEITSSHPAEE